MSNSLGTAPRTLFDNTWLFEKAVSGVSQEQAGFRIDEQTNPFDRIAGHIVVTRHGLGALLQLEIPELPWGRFAELGMGTQFDPERECPPLEDIMARFGAVTKVMSGGLTEVDDDLLSKPSPFPIPGEKPSMHDLVAFLLMHETYHIGQLGILKKCMGAPGIMV